MKTNYLTLSVMALAAAFTACSQDNEIPETNVSDNAQALTIQAAESGFEAADAESRATDNGKTTEFENGDQMGLFVVRDNGSVVKANEPITYDGTTWSTTTPVYYYTDADYIAYFPYDEDLSVSATATEDIETAIAGAFDKYFEANKADQSNLETYRNADLMLSTITAKDLAKQTSDNKTLTFALKHNYSMIELNVPSYKYSYTYGEGTKEFSVPMSNFNVTLGDTEVKPCHIGNGVYRMLVEPGDITLTGSFEDPKDQRPVNFSNASKTKNLAAGSYVKYNITYDGDPDDEVVERNIIGDYYCQDGSIYPSDLQTVPDNVIGIVFSTVGDDEELGKEGYEYYVLSIRERGKLGFRYATSEKENEKEDSKVDIADITNYNSAEEEFSKCLDDMSGLRWTDAVRVLQYNITKDLDKNWVGNQFAVPELGTTGWFIPSIGQWVKLFDIVKVDFNAPSYSSNKLVWDNEVGEKVIGLVNPLITKLNIKDANTMTGCYWSLTEAELNEGNSQVYCLEISTGKCEVCLKEKTDGGRPLRPILAF
ncbi:fimbrillin family protein [Phocaeicola salanitronis]|uniref:fimbrillin family protein n=1 Tax=Phocaeicola salanitronis TaxID=376805 RepID=UPI0023F9920D|nr:fimbrillin family protein [Phocaeicola salanitronis]